LFGAFHAVLKHCSTQILIFVSSPAPCKKRTERGTLVLCLRGFGYGLDLGDLFFGGFFVCGYNFFVFFLIVILFVFFFLAIIVAVPRVFAERGLVDRARVDDDAGFNRWFEVGAGEVRAGGLQGVEQEAGGFAV